MIQSLGAGLAGRGDELNSTLRGTNTTIEHGTALVGLLHRNRNTVADLVDHLGKVMSAVGDRGAAIDTIAHSGNTALRAIGDRDAALAETLRELPATLDRLRDATATIGDVSDSATPVVANLADAAVDLGPAISDLAVSARDGRKVIAALDDALPDLNHVALGATSLHDTLVPAVPKLKPVLCELNPMLRYLLPYRRDFLDILFHLSGASHAYDGTGHTVRLMPLLSENSISGAPPQVQNAMQALLQSGLLVGQGKRITLDPFMKPGEIAKTVAEPGEPRNREELKNSYDYPRIKADC